LKRTSEAPCVLETPIGAVAVTFQDGCLTSLSFCDDVCRSGQKTAHSKPAPAELVRHELELYFLGKLRKFSVPLRLSGPVFYKRVWDALMGIPFGETRTYRQVAAEVGSPQAFRAVGNACAANPIAIIVPCHRVVAAHGLGGYGGGLRRKEWLLRHELSM